MSFKLNSNQPFWNSAIAIGFVLVALLLMLALDPYLQINSRTFMLFYGALTLSALYGGRNAGILATLLSAFCANYFFVEPLFQFDLVDLDFTNSVRTAVFVLQGSLISVLIGRLRSAQRQTARSLQLLREREAEFRTLFEVTSVGTAQVNPMTRRFLHVNAAFCQMTGYSESELLTLTVDDINHPDDRDRDRERFMSRLHRETRDDYQSEKRYVRKDGSTVWVLAAGNMVRDPAGRPLRMVAVIQDISERKQAEQQLQETLQTLQTVIAASPLPIVVIEAGSIEPGCVESGCAVQLWNPAAERVFGWSEAEVLGKPLPIVPLEKQEECRRVRQGAINGEIFSGIETYRCKRDGSTVMVSVSAALLDYNGAIVLLFQDITEQQQATAALRSREAQLQTLFNAAPLGIYLVDQNFRLRQVNPIALPVFGNIPDLIGRDFDQVIRLLWAPADADEIAARFRHTLTTGESYYVPEFVQQRRDRGVVEYYEWQINRIPLPGGDYGVVCYFRDVSVQVMARLAIAQSEERLSLAVNSAGMATWDVDLQTGKVIWSDNHFTLLGYKPGSCGAATDELWRSRLHPDDQATVMQSVEQAKQSRSLCQVEYRIMRADNGAVRWLSAFARFAYNDAGQAVRFIGIFFDVTDRKQSEAALRDSEARLHAVAANLPQGAVFIVDRELRYQLAEGKALEGAGMTPGDFVGKTLWEALDPALADFYAPYYRQVLDGEPFSLEHYSHDRHYSSHGTPLYNSQGEVDAVLAVSYDITERKQAEEELRQKNAILDVINESAPTPIFVKDRQGRIIYANPATLAVFGKSAAEVIGYCDCDIAAPLEDALKVMENDRRIMESGQMEVVEESPDGIRTFLGMKVPYRNEAGDVVGLIGIANDITDRVQLEHDRERILQQEQAAREAAEQANRIKDEFLAVLSHELRSPLNPILGWTRLLQSGKLDEARQRDALATIERNAKLQTQLIEDLLDISRIMRGKLTLTSAPVQLTSLIPEAVETVQLAAEAKQIAIVLDLAPIGSAVWGDAARLQQVVWNLLTNAVKFTPNGGRVEVRLERVEEAGEMGRWGDGKRVEEAGGGSGGDGEMGRWGDGEPTSPSSPHPLIPSSPHPLILPAPLPPCPLAQISVTDSGKGISPSFLPYVFDYFRQEDGSTTRKFGGLGLGLAIVRQIVEMHGGTVLADSPGEGQGATFTVRLPLMPSRKDEEMGKWEDGETGSKQFPPPSCPPAPLPLTGLRILLVDDDDDTREFQAFVLEQNGAAVTAVSSSTAALAVLEQVQLDVLVSDIGMAEMNGYTLMQQIRRREALSHQSHCSSTETTPCKRGMLPAIALTAYASEVDHAQAISAGFQRHLPKPIDPETLVETILEVIL